MCTCLLFSSTAKSPGASSCCCRVSCGTSLLMRRYSSVLSSAGPEMMSGVRASSIRIESTSSTTAKASERCTRSSR